MVNIPGEDEEEGGGSVFTEKSDFEPEEFDPDSLGPPTPDATSGEIDLDSDVARLFVKLVVVFNVALLALSLGPMFAYFRGQVDLGIRIFLVGVIAFAYGTFKYVQFTRRRDDDDTDADVDTDADLDTADHNG